MNKTIEFFLIGITCFQLSTAKAQALMNSDDKDEPSINFVNGACFDFGATNTQKTNYVGLVNIFVEPKHINVTPLNSDKWLFKNVFSRFGLNAGLMKVNYAILGDTLGGYHYTRERVLIRPLDSVALNKPYLLQYNKYNYTYKNVTFSIYAQPTFQISNLDNTRLQLYINGHYEALVNRWTVTQTVTNLQQDTAYFSSNSPLGAEAINQFGDNTKSPIITTNNYASVLQYIGGGLTFVLKPGNKTVLFIQTTGGRMISSGQTLSIDNLSAPKTYTGYVNFYLTRFTLNQHINEKVTILLGGELRGHSYPKKQNIPMPKPNYACYIGLNVSLLSLFKEE